MFLRVFPTSFFCLLSMLGAFAFQASAQTPSYVGSEICGSCHREAYDSWQNSHHAEAWRLPGPDLLRGAFEGEVFEHDGMRARFFRKDGSYRVSVTEKDGNTTDYEVHSVAGTEPLQQLILETEPGRLQSFDVAWDTEKHRWFHIYPDQDLPPDDGMHWTGPYKNWNGRCAECHATGFVKNYDPATRLFASTQSEIGVGCEACHGPGSEHLRRQRGEAPASYPVTLNAEGFSANLSAPQEVMQQCAGCHSRREAFAPGSPLPGTSFHDAYNLSLLRPGLYHADGQILDEVFVYGSFLQSKMHSRGVTCSNCHEPHTADHTVSGNTVCTQCHSPAGNGDFPTLPLAEYDDPSHTHHPEGSAGAQCKSCHMIERVYMGNDGRRDHSFRIPRPDLAAITGAPDACTDCHEDQGPKWAADRIAQWFPQSQRRQTHYGEALVLGQSNPSHYSGDLATLAQNENAPAIVRASALWLLGPYAPDGVAQSLITHDDPLIRAAALANLRNLPASQRLEFLAPLLRDPVRTVRLAAAREILGVEQREAGPAFSSLYREAFRQLGPAITANLDFPEAQMKLGGFALTQRRFPQAFAAFAEATLLDPQNVDAWSIQVRIAAAIQGPVAARALLAQALEHNPGNPHLINLGNGLR